MERSDSRSVFGRPPFRLHRPTPSPGNCVGSPKSLYVSLPACHALETPAESPGTGHSLFPCYWLPLILPRRPPHDLRNEADSLWGGATPLRPVGFLVYAYTVSFSVCHLLHDANTQYGWLAILTRRGLSPRKRRQVLSWRTESRTVIIEICFVIERHRSHPCFNI